MVRKLYLLRHGRTEHGFQMPDVERALTRTGSDQVASLGKDMGKKGFCPDVIYCSTARRTRQTAGIFTGQLDCQCAVEYREEIYEASVRTLLELVAKTDDRHHTALLIGHNPGLSYLYEYLTGAGADDMLPGELVCIGFEVVPWAEVSKGTGVIVEI